MKAILVFLICWISLNLRAQTININSKNPLLPIISVTLDKKSIQRINANIHNKKLEEYLSLTLIFDTILAPVSVNGKYHIAGENIIFSPLTKLGTNLNFVIHFEDGKRVLNDKYTTPKSPISPSQANVKEVFPESEKVPKNILFFHVQFSKMMIPDINAHEYVKIFDETGIEIPLVWRQKSFWLDDQKLLVLMVHPGRVKRGINMTIPFEIGKSYTLTVSDSIRDLYGSSLASSFKHTFTIIEEDYTSPRVLFDQFIKPEPNGKDKFHLNFSEGMDHSSIIDGVKFYDENENIVKGNFSWNKSANSFFFMPENEWKSGKYTIQFEKKVCDYACNRLNRTFEITDISDREKDNIPVLFHFEL